MWSRQGTSAAPNWTRSTYVWALVDVTCFIQLIELDTPARQSARAVDSCSSLEENSKNFGSTGTMRFTPGFTRFQKKIPPKTVAFVSKSLKWAQHYTFNSMPHSKTLSWADAAIEATTKNENAFDHKRKHKLTGKITFCVKVTSWQAWHQALQTHCDGRPQLGPESL